MPEKAQQKKRGRARRPSAERGPGPEEKQRLSAPENTCPEVPGRDERGRFHPGRSGNPGGRPKAIADLRDMAREYSQAAIETLASALHAEDERVRVAAAVALLDRAWGKPAQAVAGPDGEPLPLGQPYGVIILPPSRPIEDERDRWDSPPPDGQ